MGWCKKMYKTNKQREKRLIFAYFDTKLLYLLTKILTIFLITFSIVIMVIGNFRISRQNEIKEKLFGSWNILIYDLDVENSNFLKNHKFIEKCSIQTIQEKVILNDGNRVIIGSSDLNFLELGNINLLDGEMPNNEYEVAIEKEYLETIGVKQVGDIVPKESLIKSLIGYRVCGIIDNYSSRWKMVNWDIKYINCFIKDCTPIERYLYIKAPDYVVHDIYINSINYKNNVHINDFIFEQYMEKLIILDCLMIMMIFMMRFFIKYTINKRLNASCYKIKFLKQIHIVKKYLKSFVFFLLMLYSTNLIIEIIDEYIHNIIIFSNEVKYNDIFINKFGNIEMLFNYISNKEIRYFPNIIIDSSLNFVMTILLILIVNVFIIFLQFINVNQFIKEKKDYIFIRDYYYSNRRYSIKEYLFSFKTKIAFEYLIYLIIYSIRNFDNIFYIKTH